MVRILLESMDLPDLVWNLEIYNYYGKLKSMSHNFPTRDLKFFKRTYVCAIIVDNKSLIFETFTHQSTECKNNFDIIWRERGSCAPAITTSGALAWQRMKSSTLTDIERVHGNRCLENVEYNMVENKEV